MIARTCPACRELLATRDPLCTLCWPKVPARDKKRLGDALRKLGYNPASPKVLAEHAYALEVVIRAAR